MYFDRLKERLNQYQQLYGHWQPCYPAWVDQLEQRLGLRFPAAYREFLLWLGHWSGGLLDGISCGWMHLEFNQRWARGTLMARGPIRKPGLANALPVDALVFWREGYDRFAFFRSNEGDDPPVYVWQPLSGEPGAWQSSGRHLVAFLEEALEQALRRRALLHEALVRGTPPPGGYLGRVRARYEAMAGLLPGPVRGCQEQELSELERALRCRLPAAYRELLLWLGRSHQGILGELATSVELLLPLQQQARYWLQADRTPVRLPEDAFVFYQRYESAFGFFRLSEGEDPPVYGHPDDPRQRRFEWWHRHLSDFVMAQLEESIVLAERRCLWEDSQGTRPQS
ncbi:SMI1/KNR4 family protein [Thermogemmatispora sp.]|uniref:SMI1/KNR4 family protein n=1 Tax=Thermogemmatispora sp. TaxID=1968838 RepID=UPI0035E41A1C